MERTFSPSRSRLNRDRTGSRWRVIVAVPLRTSVEGSYGEIEVVVLDVVPAVPVVGKYGITDPRRSGRGFTGGAAEARPTDVTRHNKTASGTANRRMRALLLVASPGVEEP